MIEKSALSYVGVANYGYGDAILQGVAYLKGTGKREKTLMDIVGKCVEFGTVGKIQFLMVGEVELQFQ